MMQQRNVRVVLLGLAVFFACGISVAQRPQHHATKPAQITVPALVPAPATPSVPANDVAVPPHVSYANGQLLIDARNSTLKDILSAVEQRTGAAFDIGSGDTSERVVGRLGPGPARDVLADLFNGSHFNYVMLSPAGDPSALMRVVLTPRSAAPAQTGSFQNEAQQQFQPQQVQMANGVPIQQQVQQQVQPQDPNNPDAAQENPDNPEENAENQDPAEEAQTDQAQPQEGVKTPEQLLQDLQRQQQLIQQQQLRPGQIIQPQPNQ